MCGSNVSYQQAGLRCINMLRESSTCIKGTCRDWLNCGADELCMYCTYVCVHTCSSFLSVLQITETSFGGGPVMIWCPAYLPLLKSQLFTKRIVFRWTTLKLFFCAPWLFYSFIVGEFKACHAVTPSSLGQPHNSRTQMCLRYLHAGRCRCGPFWKGSSKVKHICVNKHQKNLEEQNKSLKSSIIPTCWVWRKVVCSSTNCYYSSHL